MTPVSPGRAMAESSLRTGISLLVGFLLTLAAKWIGDRLGINIQVSDEAAEVVAGLAYGALTVLYAAAQRKLWPTSTDRAGVGRTDVTGGGRPL